MKQILVRLIFATTIVLLACALNPPTHAQQSDQGPVAKHQNEAQMPASGQATTEEAKAFTGRVVKENGEVVLKDLVTKDLVTKVIYKLDDATKAKPYLGKNVKVTGKLDLDSNTIRVESIEIIS
jgi:hypothetical protein